MCIQQHMALKSVDGHLQLENSLELHTVPAVQGFPGVSGCQACDLYMSPGSGFRRSVSCQGKMQAPSIDGNRISGRSFHPTLNLLDQAAPSQALDSAHLANFI